MINLNYFLNKNYNKVNTVSNVPTTNVLTRSRSQITNNLPNPVNSNINSQFFNQPNLSTPNPIPSPIDIILCQEPYNPFGRISHLELIDHTIFKGELKTKVRSCIIINKKLNPWKLTQFCNADQTVVCFKIKGRGTLCCKYLYAS